MGGRFKRVAIAIFVATACVASCAPAEPATTLYYTYVDQDGHSQYATSYLNVPDAFTETVGTIDIAGLNADRSLAASLAERIRSEIADIRNSASCAAAGFEQDLGRWQGAWYRFGPTVLGGIAILFLLMLTPKMSGALPPGMWSRTMFFLIPAVLAVTLLAVTAQRANRSMAAVAELGALCDTQPSSASPGAHAKDVVRLRTLAERLYRDRAFLLDRALKDAGIRFD